MELSCAASGPRPRARSRLEFLGGALRPDRIRSGAANSTVSIPKDSVAMLGCDQVADQLDELLLAASRRGLRTVVPGFRDIGGVFAVHDEERPAFDVVALGELLGALQVRAHGEGVVGLGEVVGADAVLGRE